MSRLDELLEAIRERPDDDALRLVYADALEEAGETIRADYIRSSLSGAPQAPIRDREYYEKLIGPLLSQYAHETKLDRGIVSVLYTFVDTMVEHGSELLRAGAIRFLGFRDAGGRGSLNAAAGAAIAKIPELRYLTGLSLPSATEFVSAFLSSPHLDHVTRLDLIGWRLGSEEMLARPCLPALRRLKVVVVAEHVEELRAIRHPALKALVFSVGAGVVDRAFAIIAESSLSSDMEEISVWGESSRVTGNALRAFARAPGLRSLRTLELLRIVMPDEALAPFADLGHIRLQRLSLRDCGLTSVEPILQSPACSELEELELHSNPIDDRAVDALIAWPGAANLRLLELGGNAITPQGWTRLRAAPALAKCKIVEDEP